LLQNGALYAQNGPLGGAARRPNFCEDQMFKIGTKVYDRATQRWAHIVDSCVVTESVEEPFTVYTLDSSVPDDPDFPHRQRLESEISLTKTAPLPRLWSLDGDGFKPVLPH
jgi:hypothetical protein